MPSIVIQCKKNRNVCVRNFTLRWLLIRLFITNLSHIYFCCHKSLKRTFQISFWLQNYLLNLCCRAVILKGYFVVKKIIWIYTKTVFTVKYNRFFFCFSLKCNQNFKHKKKSKGFKIFNLVHISLNNSTHLI